MDDEAVVPGLKLVIHEEKVGATVVALSEIGWGR